MKKFDTYINNISNLGIIISLMYYDLKKHYGYIYIILELIRSFVIFIPDKYFNIVNISLILYYFCLFVYFLNHMEIIYSVWNGYASSVYFLYTFFTIFVYEKKTYINGLDENHILLKPYAHSNHIIKGRIPRKIKNNIILHSSR